MHDGETSRGQSPLRRPLIPLRRQAQDLKRFRPPEPPTPLPNPALLPRTHYPRTLQSPVVAGGGLGVV